MSLYPDFVVPDASHEGPGPRARCLEGTRTRVLTELSNWKDDLNGKPICWLSGPAGFGKSAISQTIAESCAKDGRLLASFFCLRGAGGRSEFIRLITTLAFQISLSIPDAKPLIDKALRDDPTIPYQSVANQFRKLLLSPLTDLRDFISARQPLVVVIDALDECNDKRAIQEFIEVLAKAWLDESFPIRWLLTSRREEHIRRAFSDDTAQASTSLIHLEDYDAGVDIERFLTHRFSQIRQQNKRLFEGMPPSWPSLEDLHALVKKSSGLFVFASTLVDFVTDDQAPPQQKLKGVLDLNAGLDPLYAQVLSAVPNITCFRRVLTALMLLYEQPSVQLLADLLRLDAGDVLHAMSFIQSIIHVPAGNDTPIRLNHTSLRDFLVDKTRSKDLYIDPPAAHATLAIDCVKFMQSTLRRDVIKGYKKGHNVWGEQMVSSFKRFGCGQQHHSSARGHSQRFLFVRGN